MEQYLHTSYSNSLLLVNEFVWL